MENQTSQLALIAKRLDNSVVQVVAADGLTGFERAYLLAAAAQELKDMLTPEYMKPIMALQGNRLGFKTDKDATGGYPEPVVKNCLIEAVLTGVQPFGNQFNIIAGNCYITKEGCGYLLSKKAGLRYSLVPSLPRIKDESAAVVMKVKWSVNGGVQQEQELDIPIKTNRFMGADGVLGKATRKARAWLLNEVSNNGVEIGDGDVEDIDHTVIRTKTDPAVAAAEKEAERISAFIESAETIEQLDEVYLSVPDSLVDAWMAKKELLTAKSAA